MKKKILVATGQENLDKAIISFNDYEVVGRVEVKDALQEAIESTNPDIIVLADALVGSDKRPITSHIVSISSCHPGIRIIYLTNTTLNDEVKVGILAGLVGAGVYDIIYNRALDYQSLKEIIDNPKTINDKDIQRLLSVAERFENRNSEKVEIEFHVPEEVIQEELDDGSYENVVVVSSIKPGTGKSFVSTNLATAIAAYGVNTPDGKRPKVAIIEADLQNLSIGTLLHIEDKERNIKTAIDAISSVITKEGDLVEDIEEIRRVDDVIKSSFLPYSRVKNLEALVGSQLGYEDVSGLQGMYFGYLIDSIVDYYDVIIIDSNSSLAHSTTYDLLRRAKTCFYVINLDFNNVRNNQRYKSTLENIGISHKVEYILNEDVTNSIGDPLEELIFQADHLVEEGFDFIGRIPLIPKTVFLNRLYMGTPIVLDEQEYTKPAKYELLKVANSIYPIEGFDKFKPKKEKKKGILPFFN